MNCYYSLTDEEKAFLVELFKNVRFKNLNHNTEKPYIEKTINDLKYMRDSVVGKCLKAYKSHVTNRNHANLTELNKILDNLLDKIYIPTININ